jgi:hypothetical protein
MCPYIKIRLQLLAPGAFWFENIICFDTQFILTSVESWTSCAICDWATLYEHCQRLFVIIILCKWSWCFVDVNRFDLWLHLQSRFLRPPISNTSGMSFFQKVYVPCFRSVACWFLFPCRSYQILKNVITYLVISMSICALRTQLIFCIRSEFCYTQLVHDLE